jgi:hypothetical protein
METCPNCGAPATLIDPDMRGLNRGTGYFPDVAIISRRTADSAERGYGAMLSIRRQRRRLGSSVRPTAQGSVCPFLVAAVFVFCPGRNKAFPESPRRFTSAPARSLRSAPASAHKQSGYNYVRLRHVPRLPEEDAAGTKRRVER